MKRKNPKRNLRERKELGKKLKRARLKPRLFWPVEKWGRTNKAIALNIKDMPNKRKEVKRKPGSLKEKQIWEFLTEQQNLMAKTQSLKENRGP